MKTETGDVISICGSRNRLVRNLQARKEQHNTGCYNKASRHAQRDHPTSTSSYIYHILDRVDASPYQGM